MKKTEKVPTAISLYNCYVHLLWCQLATFVYRLDEAVIVHSLSSIWCIELINEFRIKESQNLFYNEHDCTFKNVEILW